MPDGNVALTRAYAQARADIIAERFGIAGPKVDLTNTRSLTAHVSTTSAHIWVSRYGLARLSKNGLDALLAHELAHVAQRRDGYPAPPQRRVLLSVVLISFVVSFVLAVLEELTGAGSGLPVTAATGVLAASGTWLIASDMAWSRARERDADRRAVAVVGSAAWSALIADNQRALRWYERAAYAVIPPFLNSHPSLRSRRRLTETAETRTAVLRSHKPSC